MNFSMKSEIILKPLKRFKLEDGDVMHALKVLRRTNLMVLKRLISLQLSKIR